jgi:hypothetical protein
MSIPHYLYYGGEGKAVSGWACGARLYMSASSEDGSKSTISLLTLDRAK